MITLVLIIHMTLPYNNSVKQRCFLYLKSYIHSFLYSDLQYLSIIPHYYPIVNPKIDFFASNC